MSVRRGAILQEQLLLQESGTGSFSVLSRASSVQSTPETESMGSCSLAQGGSSVVVVVLVLVVVVVANPISTSSTTKTLRTELGTSTYVSGLSCVNTTVSLRPAQAVMSMRAKVHGSSVLSRRGGSVANIWSTTERVMGSQVVGSKTWKGPWLNPMAGSPSARVQNRSSRDRPAGTGGSCTVGLLRTNDCSSARAYPAAPPPIHAQLPRWHPPGGGSAGNGDEESMPAGTRGESYGKTKAAEPVVQLARSLGLSRPRKTCPRTGRGAMSGIAKAKGIMRDNRRNRFPCGVMIISSRESPESTRDRTARMRSS